MAEIKGNIEQQLAKQDQLQASMQQKNQEIERAIGQGEAKFNKMQAQDKVPGQVGEKIEEGEKVKGRQ